MLPSGSRGTYGLTRLVPESGTEARPRIGFRVTISLDKESLPPYDNRAT